MKRINKHNTTHPFSWKMGMGAMGLLLLCAAAFAQRVNPLKKLQIAELAVSNLYVDSVDEQ